MHDYPWDAQAIYHLAQEYYGSAKAIARDEPLSLLPAPAYVEGARGSVADAHYRE